MRDKVSKSSLIIAMKIASTFFITYFYISFAKSISFPEEMKNHQYLITNKFSNIEEKNLLPKNKSILENKVELSYSFSNNKLSSNSNEVKIQDIKESQQRLFNGACLNETTIQNKKQEKEKEKSLKLSFNMIIEEIKHKSPSDENCETLINKYFKFTNLFFVFMLGAFINTKGCMKIGVL